MSDNNNAPEQEEEELEVIEFVDDEGNTVRFEYLGFVEYAEGGYVVLLPEDDESGEVIILQVEAEDDETESYTPVEDDSVVDAVFEIFKVNYAEYFTFD